MSVDTMVGELKSPEFDFRLLGVDRDDDLLLMIMCPRVLDLCICMDRMKSNRREWDGIDPKRCESVNLQKKYSKIKTKGIGIDKGCSKPWV